MSLYGDVWDAAYEKVAALPGFSGVRVVQRREPCFVQGQDGLPGVVVAPRADLAEQIVGERFERGADVLLEVYVGVAVLAEWTAAQAKWRMDRREEVRLALARFDGLSEAAAGQFDVEYEPSPGVPSSGWENVLESWQRFDVIVSTRRSD